MKTTLDILEYTAKMADMVDTFKYKETDYLETRLALLKLRLFRLAKMIEDSTEKERIGWLSFEVMNEMVAIKLELRVRNKNKFPRGGIVKPNRGNAHEVGEWVIQNQN
jgi:hypothetical protein